MIVRFICDELRQKELAAVVETQRKEAMKGCPFTEETTGMLITAKMIDDGFRLLEPDMLFVADTLPNEITGFMDKALIAHGFYDNHTVIVPVNYERCPKLVREYPL